jgi:hypothetical protein
LVDNKDETSRTGNSGQIDITGFLLKVVLGDQMQTEGWQGTGNYSVIWDDMTLKVKF